MSEGPDLEALSELFQDLSVQLRRLKVKEDGESRFPTSPAWDDIPTATGVPGGGIGGERAGVRTGGGASQATPRQEGGRSSSRPDGGDSGSVGPYKAAVQRPAEYFVTPVSRRGVMAGAAANVIQQQVAACNDANGFNALYQANAQANARRLMEQYGMGHPNAEVRLAATQRKLAYQDQELHVLQAGLAQANTAAQNAAAAAAAAQAVAQAAGQADRFRPANPPKYGNKDKDGDIRQWLAIVEDYLRAAPDDEYLRLASSYLEGGPRMLWQSRYDEYRRGHANAEPPQVRQFFRQTLEANYGLADLEQKHWDTWNSLRMTSGMEFGEYVVQFQQALTDLADHVQDEQIKIEKFRQGLTPDLREITRTSPAGGRWPDLQALITYAGLKWPEVKERVNRRRVGSPAQKVAGKRKSAGHAGGSPKGRARLGATSDAPKSSKATGAKDPEKPRKCFVCGSLDHIASGCPERKARKSNKRGNVAIVAAAQGDAMDQDFA
jgi:hypothetical protein